MIQHTASYLYSTDKSLISEKLHFRSTMEIKVIFQLRVGGATWFVMERFQHRVELLRREGLTYSGIH